RRHKCLLHPARDAAKLEAGVLHVRGGALMAFTAKNGRTQTSLSEINVTPFVDVVLVLLIIFMVTAPVLQSGIEVSVPKTKVVKEVSEERLVISITKGQEVYLNNDHVRLDEIGDALRKHFRDPRGQAVYVR